MVPGRRHGPALRVRLRDHAGEPADRLSRLPGLGGRRQRVRRPLARPERPEPCPEPDIRTISEAGFTWRLVCWTDEPITLEAWWPEIPDDAGLGGLCPPVDEPGGFLYCQNINYNGLSASPQEGFVGRLALSIDPASGLEMPERGQWVRVTGSFDHPAAAACADLADPEWEDSHGAVFACRRQFVPTSIEALGS